jgi:hypothetical protein
MIRFRIAAPSRARNFGASRVRAAALVIAATSLLAACGGGDSATGPDPVDDSTPRTDVPSQLAGNWMYGSISPTNFWDDHTGQYSGNAYGFSDYVILSGNGTYERYIYIYTQYYSCRTQAYTVHRGTVTVSASAIAYYPQRGKYKVTDTCVSSRNYERNMTSEEVHDAQGESWDWELGTGSNGQTVLLLGPSGSGEQVEYRPM